MTTDAFNFSDWLAGVETPAEGVTIYQKPGLIAQLAKAQEVLDSLKLEPGKTPERSLGDADPQLRVQELRRQVAASKTVWYVSPLDRETEQAIIEANPEPQLAIKFEQPVPRLADRASQEQSEAFLKAWDAYKEDHARWETEHADELRAHLRNLEQVALQRGAERVAAAVTYIETFDEVGKSTRKRATLTAQDVLSAEKRLGTAQMGLLVEALDRVTTQPPADPDPFE